MTHDTPHCITWRWEEANWHHMHHFFSNLMAMQGRECAGQSKGLMTESEFVCRMIATIIVPLEISWVAHARGVDMLYINMAYALTDQNGELHPPKDENRIEIGLSDTLQTLIRQQVLSDAAVLADSGFPTAPGFLRQMGRDREAQVTEARLQQQETTVPPAQKGKRRIKEPSFDVAAIVGEKGTGMNRWMLVRWAGYHPSWEAWREPEWEGQPGDPVESWQRVTPNLLQTEAARKWTQERREREQQRRRRRLV